MARLIFFDDTHTYTVDGEEFPSVSEISRFASREIYGEVNQYNLDNAASRGSAVHKATEILDKYGKVECDEDIVPYLQAYVQFRKDFGIKDYAHIEKALANEELKYAGTLDRIYTIDENFAKARFALEAEEQIDNTEAAMAATVKEEVIQGIKEQVVEKVLHEALDGINEEVDAKNKEGEVQFYSYYFKLI